jgi:hypothetical protein
MNIASKDFNKQKLLIPLSYPTDSGLGEGLTTPHRKRTTYYEMLHRATGWMIGILRFDSRRGLGIFLFTTASRTALWPT